MGRIAAALVLALGAGATPALANTITVTTTQDVVNPSDHVCSLREAILTADNPGSPTDCGPAPQSQANTILLGPHTYALSIPHSSDDGSSGHLAMFTIRTLTIQGAGPSTVIDASGLGDQVVKVVPGASAALRNLTITGGHAPDGTTGSTGSAADNSSTNGGDGGPGTDGTDGGGIQNDGALTLDHVIVSGNHAGNGGDGGPGGQGYGGAGGFNTVGGTGGTGGQGGRGGGVFNDGRLTVIDSTITGNHAGTGGAGGLGGPPGTPGGYRGGNGGPGGTSGDGGGIASVGSGDSLTVVGSTITGNFAGKGGRRGSGR